MVVFGIDTSAVITQPLLKPMKISGEQSLNRTLLGMPRTRRSYWHPDGAFSSYGSAVYADQKPRCCGFWMRSEIVIKNPSLGLSFKGNSSEAGRSATRKTEYPCVFPISIPKSSRASRNCVSSFLHPKKASKR